MTQAKNKEVTKNDKISKQITGLTMQPDLLDLIDKEAELMERTRVAQIRVCVREWFQMKGKVAPANPVPPGAKPVAQVRVAPPAVQAIIDDDSGWEGSPAK